jgi:hypothetical protein
MEPAGVAALLPIGKYWFWVGTDNPHYLIKMVSPSYTMEFVEASVDNG